MRPGRPRVGAGRPRVAEHRGAASPEGGRASGGAAAARARRRPLPPPRAPAHAAGGSGRRARKRRDFLRRRPLPAGRCGQPGCSCWRWGCPAALDAAAVLGGVPRAFPPPPAAAMRPWQGADSRGRQMWPCWWLWAGGSVPSSPTWDATCGGAAPIPACTSSTCGHCPAGGRAPRRRRRSAPSCDTTGRSPQQQIQTGDPHG